jgi:hypothetical protein
MRLDREWRLADFAFFIRAIEGLADYARIRLKKNWTLVRS